VGANSSKRDASEPGSGRGFEVAKTVLAMRAEVITLTRDDQTPGRRARRSVSGTSPSPCVVLVDDNNPLLEELGRALRLEGAVTVYGVSQRGVLQLCMRVTPGVVVCHERPGFDPEILAERLGAALGELAPRVVVVRKTDGPDGDVPPSSRAVPHSEGFHQLVRAVKAAIDGPGGTATS
jgi:hypothetical protein